MPERTEKKTPEHILLIDDDEDDCLIFQTALSELDTSIKFTYTQNGLSALNNLREEKEHLPDLLLLDWNMPKFNGRDFLLKIREQSDFKTFPIIVISTSKSPHDIKDAIELGASKFLTKPNSIKDLTFMLKQLLNAE